VERRKLKLLRQEQFTTLGGKDADLLRVGQLAGANYIVVAEPPPNPSDWHVLVRIVAVETGAVVMSGSASIEGVPQNKNMALTLLTGLAWNRAVCREEFGDVWDGMECQPSLVSGQTSESYEDRPIWRDMERMEGNRR